MDINRPWDLNDIAECYGLTRRVCDNLSRDRDCHAFPTPVGSLGRSRIYDPLSVRAAREKVLEYVAGSANRSISQREAELKLQQEAHERRVKEFEAQMQRGREMREMFRQAEIDNAAEQAGGNPKRGNHIVPLSGGSQ